MSSKESNIKQLIQDYLLDEGLLRGKIPDPKLNFGIKMDLFPKTPFIRAFERFLIVPLTAILS